MLDHEGRIGEFANIFEGHVDNVLDPKGSDEFSVRCSVDCQKNGLDGVAEGYSSQLDSL